MTGSPQQTTCHWCSNTVDNHRHYTVLCYLEGTCIGRLDPRGHAVKRKIRASILGKTEAEAIAAEINAEGVFTATVRPF